MSAAPTCARRWKLYEEGYHYDTIDAASAEDALEIARDRVDADNYPGPDGDGLTETTWIDVRVVCDETGEEDSASVTLDPPAPDCEDGEEHDWADPLEVVGGIRSNPGVFGHGGGVILVECCLRCGCKRTTDTWAQRPDTGEQGLTSVAYVARWYCDDEDWQRIHAERHEAEKTDDQDSAAPALGM